MRLVMDERKAADLRVGEPIRLTLTVPADKDAWTGAYLDLVRAETSCVAADVVIAPEGSPVGVRVERA